MAANHDLEEVSIWCPWCGNCELMALEDAEKHWILCQECGACGPLEESPAKALLSLSSRYDPHDAKTIFTRAAKAVPTL